MPPKDTESQLLTRYWVYLALLLVFWLGAVGFMIWQLQPIFSPPLTVPSPPSIPAIEEARINNVQELLNERSNLPSYTPAESEFRAEPFD